MTKRPITGRAIVSPCPARIPRRVRKSTTDFDGGKSEIQPEATGCSKRNGVFHVNVVTVTMANAGVMSGLSRATLYRLIDRGELDTVKVGRRRLVKVDSIKRLVGAA